MTRTPLKEELVKEVRALRKAARRALDLINESPEAWPEYAVVQELRDALGENDYD